MTGVHKIRNGSGNATTERKGDLPGRRAPPSTPLRSQCPVPIPTSLYRWSDVCAVLGMCGVSRCNEYKTSTWMMMNRGFRMLPNIRVRCEATLYGIRCRGMSPTSPAVSVSPSRSCTRYGIMACAGEASEGAKFTTRATDRLRRNIQPS